MSRNGWDFIDNVSEEIGLEVRFQGYYDLGVCSGPVERCYAPESEDEREVVGVLVDGDEISLEELNQRLLSIFEKQINDFDISSHDNDY